MKDTHHARNTYLALGDSMSIDEYTGVRGGGAVAQFYRRLQGRQDGPWRLIDRTTDGHRMADIDFRGPADLITMTIGGNDLVQHIADDPAEFVPLFEDAYRDLAAAIRKAHPQATIIVGNVYQPQGGLPRPLAPPWTSATGPSPVGPMSRASTWRTSTGPSWGMRRTICAWGSSPRWPALR